MAIKHLRAEHHPFLVFAVLVSGFFLVMSTALVTYINSSFLEAFVGAKWVGGLFSLAFLITIAVVQNYGRMIERWGNSYVLYGNMLLQALAYVVLAQKPAPWIAVLAFILFIATTSTTIINYDVYLKALAPVNQTGRLRGLFWTMANLGFLVSPALTGWLIDQGGYPLVYLVSAAIMAIPFIIMFVAYNGHRYRLPYREHEPLMMTVRRMWGNRNMRGIFLIAFVLYFFYSWMVVYTPLYLLQSGFRWDEIGVIFSIMLLPFVLVEFPAGYIADKYLGETEMLTAGFAIMSLSVFVFLIVDSYFWIAVLLFLSRVGASLVEIMRESYFYKIVQSGDLDMIDTFRNTSPAANMIAPAIATALLAAGVGLHGLFLVLGLLLTVACVLPGTLKDTR